MRATCHLAEGATELFEKWITELRRDGLDVSVTVGDDTELDADIVFACGLLTVKRMSEGAKRRIVAAPIFEGETAAVYRSYIIARADAEVTSLYDGAALRLAVNEYDSWSGWHGLKEHLRTTGTSATAIGDHVVSGGHVASLAAVLDGRADIAAIDHSVFVARTLVDPRLSELVIIESTREWPSPPLSISTALPVEVQADLTAALTALPTVVATSAEHYRFMLAEVDDHPT